MGETVEDCDAKLLALTFGFRFSQKTSFLFFGLSSEISFELQSSRITFSIFS